MGNSSELEQALAELDQTLSRCYDLQEDHNPDINKETLDGMVQKAINLGASPEALKNIIEKYAPDKGKDQSYG